MAKLWVPQSSSSLFDTGEIEVIRQTKEVFKLQLIQSGWDADRAEKKARQIAVRAAIRRQNNFKKIEI